MKYIYLLFILFLTGCSSLLTSKEDVRYFYVLDPVQEVIEVTQPAPVRLAVQRPIIPGWLDTQHIMLRHQPNLVDFYYGARWVENAGDMLGSVIMQSVENNNLAHDVFYSVGESHADYILLVEVIAFQAEYNAPEQPPVVEVVLQGKLMNRVEDRLVKSFMISNSVPARQNELTDIVQAFDLATQYSMDELVRYTARGLSVRYYAAD